MTEQIHTRGATHNVRQLVRVLVAGVEIGTRTTVDLVAGSGITLVGTDDATNDRVTVTFSVIGPLVSGGGQLDFSSADNSMHLNSVM